SRPTPTGRWTWRSSRRRPSRTSSRTCTESWRCRVQALATVALLTSLLGAGPPGGDSALAEAKSHVEAARKAFVARKFNIALQEFQAAQRLKPAPVLWFNIG